MTISGYIFTTIFTISLAVSMEGAIRRFPAGEKLLNQISDGTLSFMKWRASSDAKESLKGLSKLLGWSLVFLFSIFSVLVFSRNKILNAELSMLLVFVFWGWVSLQWFFDVKAKLMELIPFMALTVVSPLIMILIEGISPSTKKFLNGLEPFFEMLGITLPANIYLVALYFSLFLLICSLFFLLSLSIVFLMPSGFVFLCLFVLNKTCDRWLKNRPVGLYYLALAYMAGVTIWGVASLFPSN